MKTKNLSWLVLAFFSISLLNLNAQSETEMPIAEMEFEQNEYDFGIVKEGTKVTQVYTFTNTSEEPLILTSAKGSCGCTVPEWPRGPIMSGETASITVEFNSKNKKGKRNQKVTLTANTNPPQTFIYLKGEIVENEDAEILIDADTNEPVEFSPDCVAVYPNPTAEVLKLKMREDNFGQPAIISIYSQGGQLMAKREIENIEGLIEFSVSHYPAGTYMANVVVGDHKPETHCFVVID